MAYLMPEYESSDGAGYFRNEILRLQELCADNFAKIDALKKENKKLQDLHTELKETTSDLAYSLAECPWWEKESLEAAVKILASFAQKIQYILELPTFIDPVEQLNRNRGLANGSSSSSSSSKMSNNSSTWESLAKICGKCTKKFIKSDSYKRHKRLHPSNPKSLTCKTCTDNKHFSSFGALRAHFNTIHSLSSLNNNHKKTTEETYSNLREILQRNHVKVLRFFKCQFCEASCPSMGALKRHFIICRSKVSGIKSDDKRERKEPSKPPEKSQSSSSEEGDKPLENVIKPPENIIKIPAAAAPENPADKPGENLTIAQAPVRLSTMHTFSISSPPPSKSSQIPEESEEISAEIPAYYLSSSSSSLDSEVETSFLQKTGPGGGPGEILLKKFICNQHQCSKSFSTRAKLAHHHRKCHRKRSEELLSCQVCGKEFHDKYRFKTHWYSHCPRGFAPKPMYRCLECGKFHKNLNELADHSKKAHPVSKLPRPLYSCSSCGFRTNFRRKFDVHLKQKCKNNPTFSGSLRGISGSNPRGFSVPNSKVVSGPNSRGNIPESSVLNGVTNLKNLQQPSTSFRKN